MTSAQTRIFGIALIVCFSAAGSAAVADELPGPDELSEMEGAGVDELEDEEDGDDVSDSEGETEEVDEESSAEAEEADEEPAAEAEGTDEDDDWETPLRNPISPVINTEGSLGFHDIASAASPGAMKFQVGLLGQASGGSHFIRYTDEHAAWRGNVLVNASFHEYFGAHFGIQARNHVNTFGRPRAMLSQGDMNLGAIGRYPVYDGIHLGGDVNLYSPAMFDGVGLAPLSTSIRPRLLGTFDVDEIMGAQDDLYVPVVVHANIGYRVDNTENLIDEPRELDRVERTAYGISAYDSFEFGLGAEFPLPYVTPFLGWRLDLPVPRTAPEYVCESGRALQCVAEAGGASFPQTLSFGAKGEPIDNLGLHAGMDIGLTRTQAEGLPVTLPYQFHFGVSWNIDPASRVETEEIEIETEVEPPRGTLEATLLDEESGEPVEGARITYIDLEVNEQLSRAESGLFRSYEFEPGKDLVLEIDHDDYETEYVDWVVDEGTVEREVTMEPIERLARATGQVVDADGAPVAGARVVVRPDVGETAEVEADGDGEFDVEFDAGSATVAAIVDGRLTRGQYLEVEPDDVAEVSLVSEEVEEWIVGIDGRHIGLDEDIPFDEGTAEFDAEAAAMLFDQLASLVLENPDLGLLEIAGHTDDQGEHDELMELSQNRADAVRDALIERGISPDRLDAEGYGSTQPMMPNTSSRNRAMNQRIEFEFEE